MAQQVLAEDLAGFQFGGGPAGAEDPQPGRLEGVDDAGGQRGLGPDHGQAHVVLLGELDQRREVGRLDVDVLAVQIGAGVAGGHEHAVRARALRDLPGQGVFPPPAADDQNVHAKVPPRERTGTGVILMRIHRGWKGGARASPRLLTPQTIDTTPADRR